MCAKFCVFNPVDLNTFLSRIYSRKQTGLFWSLPSAEDGTAVSLVPQSTSLSVTDALSNRFSSPAIVGLIRVGGGSDEQKLRMRLMERYGLFVFFGLFSFP